MKILFQLLDSDYIILNNKPVIRLFGRTDDEKSTTVFYDKFSPYFYVLSREGKETDVKDYIEKNFKNLVIKIESVEKTLPMGYQEKPSKLLKITLNDPSKTPNIRDDLKGKEFIQQIFEADILFKYRFMADYNLFGMRWYEIEGNYTQTNSVKTDKKFTAKSFKEVEKIENMKLRYLSFDIETISDEMGIPNPEKNPIIIISLFFYPSFKNRNTLILAAKKVKKYDDDIVGFESEKDMLKRFVEIVNEFDPDIILGYNTNNFDLPYLNTRLKKNNVPRTLGRCEQKSMMIHTFMGKSRATIPGRVSVDVYNLVKEATAKFGLFKGLKRFGLGDVSENVLGEGKIDVAHSEINDYWNDNGEKLEKLLKYGRKDAELPIKILLKKNMLDKFIEISKVSGINLQECLDGGETQRIDSILLREFNKRGFVIPCMPDNAEVSRRNSERRGSGLKGAFVLDPDVGFYDTCVAYLDFKSMYPSIIISYNICPTTLLTEKNKDIECKETPFGSKFVNEKVKKGIFPEILAYLLETRNKIKKQMKAAKKEEKKNYLYSKQYAFKTVANAFYGYSGYVRARFYILDIASGITSVGRYMIKKTRSIVHTKTPYKVIYGDTDSVMVKLNTKDLNEAFKMGEEVSNIINEGINHVLTIKIDSIFKTVVLLAKKRYAAWNFEPMKNGWDESILTKGIETVRRDWCDLVSETLEKVLNTILKEQDVKKAVKIVKETVNDIKTGKVDVDKLIITKSVSRGLKSYKGIQPHIELVKKMKKRDPSSAPGVGDRVGYVIVKGVQMLSKRTEDPEYVKKHKIPIDSKYYIDSQLMPPLERLFEALNVNKSDLVGIGKQLGIFEALKNGNNKKEEDYEKNFSEIDEFICDSCNNVYRRPPLTGKCNSCGGEIFFKKGEKKSKSYFPLT